MAHLNKNCPEICGVDASTVNGRQYGCRSCLHNPNMPNGERFMNFGKDLAGNEYTGTIEQDGSMKTWVNGRLVVKK